MLQILHANVMVILQDIELEVRMPEGAFDRLARNLESLQGRRASLKVIGVAAVAAAMAPSTA